MDKEKIQEELKDIAYAIQFHREQGDFHNGVAVRKLERAKHLEAQLAEEQKPKLRHGDYGYDCNGDICQIVSVVESEGLRCAGRNTTTTPLLDDVNKVFMPDPVLGNIFDHLKAIAEPLDGDIFYLGSLKIAMFNNIVHFGNHGQGYPVEVAVEDLHKLTIGLQRLQYTERKKHEQEKA